MTPLSVPAAGFWRMVRLCLHCRLTGHSPLHDDLDRPERWSCFECSGETEGLPK